MVGYNLNVATGVNHHISVVVLAITGIGFNLRHGPRSKRGIFLNFNVIIGKNRGIGCVIFAILSVSSYVRLIVVISSHLDIPPRVNSNGRARIAKDRGGIIGIRHSPYGTIKYINVTTGCNINRCREVAGLCQLLITNHRFSLYLAFIYIQHTIGINVNRCSNITGST